MTLHVDETTASEETGSDDEPSVFCHRCCEGRKTLWRGCPVLHNICRGTFDLGRLGGAEEGRSSAYPVVLVLCCGPGPGLVPGGHWRSNTGRQRLHHPAQSWSPDWTFQLCCLCGRPVTSLPPGVSSPSLSPRWKDYHGRHFLSCSNFLTVRLRVRVLTFL